MENSGDQTGESGQRKRHGRQNQSNKKLHTDYVPGWFWRDYRLCLQREPGIRVSVSNLTEAPAHSLRPSNVFAGRFVWEVKGTKKRNLSLPEKMKSVSMRRSCS